MPRGSTVDFYFDFISPYSYLASQLIERRPELMAIDFRYRPVVFGSMLSKLGSKGPGEIPSRRRAGLQDVLLLADHYGLPLEGPPTHPFNSIYALRSVCAVADEVMRGKLMRSYFKKTWGEGKSLEDLGVLRACLAELGIVQDPEEAASVAENRRMLKSNTQEALDRGAWGVPTFMVDGLIFFGHDRLDLLASYLSGRCGVAAGKLDELLGRPQPGRLT
jgi:2-hydroxychromene-2-carboxylate isomerase